MKTLATLLIGLFVLEQDATEQFMQDMQSYQRVLTDEPVYRIDCSFLYREVDGGILEDLTYTVAKDRAWYVVEMPAETRIYRTDRSYLVQVFSEDKEVVVSRVDSMDMMRQLNGASQFTEDIIRNQLREVSLAHQQGDARTYHLSLTDGPPGYRVTLEVGSDHHIRYTIDQQQNGVAYQATSDMELHLNQRNPSAEAYRQLFQAAVGNRVLPPNYSLYNLTFRQ